MRYAIISDIHANLEATETVFDRIDELGIEQTICLGDVVGYNANPNECVNLLRERNIPTVSGNHDVVACGLEEPWGFNPVALEAALWTREALTKSNYEWLRELPNSQRTDSFLAVHGAPSHRDQYLITWEDALVQIPLVEQENHSLCFFGHTHSPGVFSSEGAHTLDHRSRFPIGNGRTLLINPGSVGQPRDGDPRASFGIADFETNEYELVRLDYPVKKTAKRVVAEGLPEVLGERLFLGR